MNERTSEDQETSSRQWEPMKITHAGHVGNVVQQGRGKLIGSTYDPGEVGYKPRGHDK